MPCLYFIVKIIAMKNITFLLFAILLIGVFSCKNDDDNPVRDFFDFFHNRYTSLIYRVWKKYRYHVQYQSDATDDFSGRMLHLAGLSNVIQESDTIGLDRAKILSYVNQLSTRTRSPKLISGIVAHYFSLPSVRIEEWVFRRVKIAECQRNQLNRTNCILGSNLHLGKSIPDLNGKFNLCIDNKLCSVINVILNHLYLVCRFLVFFN